MLSCLVLEQRGQVCNIFIADPDSTSSYPCVAYHLQNDDMVSKAEAAIKNLPNHMGGSTYVGKIEDFVPHIDKHLLVQKQQEDSSQPVWMIVALSSMLILLTILSCLSSAMFVIALPLIAFWLMKLV